MKRQPDIYTAGGIHNQTTSQTPDGRWVPCRPYPHNAFGFTWRWKLAWGVLTGKYDALKWEI